MTTGKKLGYGILAFAVFALAINAPGMIEGRRQLKTFRLAFNSYAQALVSRDYQAAYLLGGDDFREAMTPEAFSSQQQRFESNLGKLVSVDAQNLYVHGKGSPVRWMGLVGLEQRYDHGALHFVCEFHVESGKWRLFGCKQT